jgi:hypothetical protein
VRKGPEALVAVTLALVAGAAAAVANTNRVDPARTERSREFQRAVGGLGLGTALDLSRCARGFDPRVEDACSGRHDPAPWSAPACPRHKSLLPPPGAGDRGGRSRTE